MATRHATGRLRRPSAMQLNNIGIAEGANIDLSVICRLILVQSAPAAGRATQDGRAGACCSCPSLWSQRRGVRLNPRVEVIKLYQGLVRYELSLRPTLRSYNCGVCR